MSRKTSIETEFGLDLDVGNPDIGKCIAAGIRTEERQALFYSGMEGVLHNHVLMRFFGFLSREKNLQKGILEKLRKNLEKGRDWIRAEYDQTDIGEVFREAGKLRDRKLRRDAGDIDAVSKAAETEEDAKNFYERLADTLRGPGNDFFRRLAEREQRHHDLLASILDLLKQAK